MKEEGRKGRKEGRKEGGLRLRQVAGCDALAGESVACSDLTKTPSGHATTALTLWFCSCIRINETLKEN